MHQVGLTAGGFYSHFPSKEALFSEAMASALAPRKTLGASGNSAAAGADTVVALIKGYLSRAHRDAVADGCPLPSLTSDVARKSDATRESYEQEFLKYVNQIEAMLPDGVSSVRERALAVAAQCVGGLMLSRAVMDQQLSDQILKSSRDAAMNICEK